MILSLAVALCVLVGSGYGADAATLVGTWTSKSNKVFTGPKFFDPVKEAFIEPELPGISFSFTSDKYFEEAIYVIVPNPANPKCPKGVLQFQHGKYEPHTNGSITLIPLEVDGRQLVSDPCASSQALYTRYNQTELYQKYEVVIDPYVVASGKPGQYPSKEGKSDGTRLNLFKFDGAPMQPLYRFSPDPSEMMHPTTTLRPITATATPTKAAHKKRAISFTSPSDTLWAMDLDKWWWVGLVMTILGAVGFFYI